MHSVQLSPSHPLEHSQVSGAVQVPWQPGRQTAAQKIKQTIKSSSQIEKLSYLDPSVE